ncbi:MAG TPA: hemolysin III family protein [Xanthobacteraceae bacterium]
MFRKRRNTLAAGLPAWFCWDYDPAELRLDAAVHAFAVSAGLAAAATLFAGVLEAGLTPKRTTALLYAIGLLAMLCASAAYSLWPLTPTKWLLRRFDQAVIYLFIAATCTAFLAHARHGWIALAVVWPAALLGAALKLAWPGRCERLCIGSYFLLGWAGACGFWLGMDLPGTTVRLIVLGGLLYTAGLLFYLWERLRFHYAIWHLFALVGAASHFLAVLTSLPAFSA